VVHSPDNLIAGDDWHLVKREIALDNMNAGAANRADAHFYPDLTWPARGASISRGVGGDSSTRFCSVRIMARIVSTYQDNYR
jgi:hypothetical protein